MSNSEDVLEEWQALNNLARSPYHPTLKSVLLCIWTYRNWNTLLSCPSQDTIGENCGLSTRTVRTWTEIGEQLGFYTRTMLGGKEFRSQHPELAKFTKPQQRYILYTIDLTSDVWSKGLTREEIVAKNPAAVLAKKANQCPGRRIQPGRVLPDSNPEAVFPIEPVETFNPEAGFRINPEDVFRFNPEATRPETFLSLLGADEQVVTTKKSLSDGRSCPATPSEEDIDEFIRNLP